MDRLKEEQHRVIADTKARIKALEKFRDDYKVLQDRLCTLPDEVTHNVMVPFGKLAFMPGKLVHTNELTVLLGDNWFAERSAKQACDIIKRRIKAVNEQIEGFNQQASLLEPRVDFTEELSAIAQQKGGMFEIREEYDEAKEKVWKAEHRERMRQYKREKYKGEATKRQRHEAEPPSDAELWLRLDELEAQEHHEKEMEQSDEDAEVEVRCDVNMRENRLADLHNKTDTDEVGEGEDEDEDDEDDDEGDKDEEMKTASKPSTINFQHSKLQVSKVLAEVERNKESSSGSQIVTSPADIYRQFGISKPCSILKSSRVEVDRSQRHVRIAVPENSDDIFDRVSEPASPELPAKPQSEPKAFTGSVVERGNYSRKSETEQRSEGIEENRGPVSRFKAQRMHRQKQGKL